MDILWKYTECMIDIMESFENGIKAQVVGDSDSEAT